METLTFKLQEDNFEGPLDLLLYLVGKNKMNLYDINIMELIEQYTAAIQTMQADKLEGASPKNRKARRNIPANRIPTGWCRRGSA